MNIMQRVWNRATCRREETDKDGNSSLSSFSLLAVHYHPPFLFFYNHPPFGNVANLPIVCFYDRRGFTSDRIAVIPSRRHTDRSSLSSCFPICIRNFFRILVPVFNFVSTLFRYRSPSSQRPRTR